MDIPNSWTRMVAIITTVLLGFASPGFAETSINQEHSLRAQCVNNGGSWTGSDCSYPERYSARNEPSGGGGFWTVVFIGALGAIACAATDCLDQTEGE